MGLKNPRGGVWFGFPGLPEKRASDFFVLPDYCNPAKSLAGCQVRAIMRRLIEDMIDQLANCVSV